MEIFAHRGASAYYPENTMLSFEKAIEMGCTGIETDVQMTKDGVLVLMHDERVDRTTGEIGYVKEFTFNEIRKLNAGYYKHFKFCQIPTAEELLELGKEKGILINFELKTYHPVADHIEDKLVQLIYKYEMQNNVIISSFFQEPLLRCRQLDSTIRLALLTTSPVKISCLSSLGIHIVHPIYYLTSFIVQLKQNHFNVNVFTVNKKRQMKKFMKLNVDGLITDMPDVASQVILSQI